MLKDLKNWEIKKIDYNSKEYPVRLKKLKNYPKVLYYRGEWDPKTFNTTLSVVGSRKMTEYGKAALTLMMPEFVGAGITIISGFMYGVDTLAHEECVKLGGKTIAVLGSGLNVINPSTNRELYTKILETGGIILSEYEPEFKSTVWSFPQRNRIVAALATRGILIVEAGLNSGSLITAEFGLKLDKDIFCVPGSITSPISAGCNQLLKNCKVKAVTSASDILDEKDRQTFCQVPFFSDGSSDLQQKIIDYLKSGPKSINELCRLGNFNVSDVSQLISILTIQGSIKEIEGKYYL